MHHIALALSLLVALVPFAEARGHSSSGRSSSHRTATRGAKPKSPRCTSCARDSRGRIARRKTAKREFQRTHPCPSTGKTPRACRGYVIDHIVPLKRGGADSPSNMQWQTKAEAKAKDKVE